MYGHLYQIKDMTVSQRGACFFFNGFDLAIRHINIIIGQTTYVYMCVNINMNNKNKGNKLLIWS